MNALVKKEIRLLLPNFGFACVLALAGLFPNHADSLFSGIVYFIGCIFCPAVVVMLALSSFGSEVGSGTFSNLLAQPVSRVKIWETKITLLAAALLAVAFLWLMAFVASGFHGNQNHGFNDWLDLLAFVIVFGLVIFSGGLWTVLLLRQVAAAFWFTLLVPGALLVILAALFSEQDGNLFAGLIISVLGLYSLAGVFFARWLFLRAQDLQWSGGNIVLPELDGLARFRPAAGVRREWCPRPALWWKEFMLHQSQLIMAFALALLHLGVLAARHFLNLAKSPDLKFVLEIFWGLWLVMPLLIGCAAVAEERKLGTLEGQLCLPVRRWTQFGIKFTVALGLALVLGAAMPLLFEGSRIVPGPPLSIAAMQNGWLNQLSTWQVFIWNCIMAVNLSLPVLVFVFVAATTCAISFYVSTLARNTLQSLAPAVLGIMLAATLLGMAGQSWSQIHDFLWSGPLPYFIGIPIMALTLLLLSFRNFQQARTSLRMGWTNLAVLTGALVLAGVMTSAIYHRFWEKLTPFEPAHGAARLKLANPPQARLNVWWAETTVHLPDGKTWTAQFASKRNLPAPMAQLFGSYQVALEDKKLFNGSNWVDIRHYSKELIGTKTDGTLWISEAPMSATRLSNGTQKIDEQKMRNLVQFGSETNWRTVLPEYRSALLVKNDGTLWRLGTNWRLATHRVNEKWPELRSFTPYRLGTESDWLGGSLDYSQFTLQKTNGSIWISLNDHSHTNGLKVLELELGFAMVQLYDGAHGKYRSLSQITHGLPFKVGILEDGTFRIWADMRLGGKRRTYDWAPADLQIGSSTNWLALAGGNEKIVTLKDDGTLWLWDFRDRSNRGWDEAWSEQDTVKIVPTRLGSCSDWIAISGSSESVVALAADGSLWFWPLYRPENFNNNHGDQPDQPDIQPWLDFSRKPQLLGNVFAEGR
ncbi:MAG: ABC transporter permease subunit [Verrucomicrobiae bacterium]|nr:ABC transporter permease subunit [Verrucomicrobiae bacterium]